jgi:hypothetical protein
MEAERAATTAAGKAAGEAIVTNESDRVFVSFLVEKDGEEFHERLHARPLENDLYCLDNSPFYAYGVSFQRRWLRIVLGDPDHSSSGELSLPTL